MVVYLHEAIPIQVLETAIDAETGLLLWFCHCFRCYSLSVHFLTQRLLAAAYKTVTEQEHTFKLIL